MLACETNQQGISLLSISNRLDFQFKPYQLDAGAAYANSIALAV